MAREATTGSDTEAAESGDGVAANDAGLSYGVTEEADAGADPNALLSRGLGIAGSYLSRLAKQQGDLDFYEASALAKLLSSFNIIRRDEDKAGKGDLNGATPEDVARQMAEALGPEAIVTALVGLIGEDEVASMLKTAARRARAEKVRR